MFVTYVNVSSIVYMRFVVAAWTVIDTHMSGQCKRRDMRVNRIRMKQRFSFNRHAKYLFQLHAH